MNEPSSTDATLAVPAATSGASPSQDATLGRAAAPPSRGGASVLQSHEATLPVVPRVRLRNSADETQADARFGAEPAMAELGTSRVQLHGEIARGGMGVVLYGRDNDLGRDIAVKVLLHSSEPQTELWQRFIEEAQIGGQLQHPGVVPVYELGQFSDQRPYFTMKLVKGETLSKLLKQRSTPSQDAPRFLKIFEQICQTLAYAHAKGVVHRDLKPSNVMVGSFGEVQVMDWGLAKVLDQSGVAPPSVKATEVEPISRLISPSAAHLNTQAGSVMGTPAYMAPEQAIGEVDRIDERSDVFGLGAILCEILTGGPPYVSADGERTFRMAVRAELGDAHDRLNACQADADLVALAKRCLAPEPADRPRDAGVLAAAITAYLESVDARLRQAELAGAAAEARVVEERKRRKVQLALGASVLATVLVVGAGGLWISRDRAARDRAALAKQLETTRRVNEALVQARSSREQARTSGQERDWIAAREQAQFAVVLIEGNPVGLELATQVEHLARELEDEDRHRRLLTRIDDIRLLASEIDERESRFTWERILPEYQRAFAEFGQVAGETPPEDVARWFRTHSIASRDQLLSEFDHWLTVAHYYPQQAPGVEDWVARVVELADDDPLRKELRAAVKRQDQTALERLAADPNTLQQPAPTLRMLGHALLNCGAREAGIAWLCAAQMKHPNDFWLNYELAEDLQYSRPPAWEEAIRYYTAALAIRPGAVGVRVNLGNALANQGRHDEALVAIGEAIATHPGYAVAHNNRGLSLAAQGRFDEALAAYRQAIHLQAEYALAYSNLGLALAAKGDLTEALAASRRAAELRPKLAGVQYNLGVVLASNKQYEDAIVAYRQATKLNANDPLAHYNLGTSLLLIGRADESIAPFRKAIELQPDYADAYCNLGHAHEAVGQLPESLAALRRGHELGSRRAAWRNPSGDWVKKAEGLVELESRLPTILKGEASPMNAAEGLELARVCYLKRRFAAASRFFADAFAAEPKLIENMESHHGYDAASCATLAGAGLGEDAGQLEDVDRATWRRRAIAWLRDDLAKLGKLLERGGATDRTLVVVTLRHWQRDGDVATLRDKELVKSLAPAEQQACQDLWADVVALLNEAQSSK